MEQTFEQFLQEAHSKAFPQILDDDLTDSFNDWLSDLDIEQILKYGELYGKSREIAGAEKVLKIFNK